MAHKLEIRFALIAAALAAGCSSSSSDDGGQTQDLRPGPDLATGGRDAAPATCEAVPSLITSDGSCNAVPYPTKRVPFTARTDTPPTFTGGPLLDGLYAAIKAEGWGTTTGSGRQMGIVLMNGGKTMLWFGQTLNADGSGDAEQTTTTNGLAWLRANFDLSNAADNRLKLDKTCGAGTTSGPPELLYTATTTHPPQLILANPSAADPTSAVTTYEWQSCPPKP
jgi:hypothetical protein